MGKKAPSFLIGMSPWILPAIASATPLRDLPDDANQLIFYLFLATSVVAVILLAVYVSRNNVGEGKVPVVFSPWNLLYLVMFGLLFASALGDRSEPFKMIALATVLVLLGIRLFLNIRATRPALGTAITAYQVVLCFLAYAVGLIAFALMIGGFR